MGGGLKKEYRSLAGLPVLLHSLLPFFSLSSLIHTVITLPEGDEAYVVTLLESLPPEHRERRSALTLVSGGKERSASVRSGLQAFPHAPDFVLIHDGARPWISPRLVASVAEETVRSGACIPVVPSTDAMKGIDEQGVVRSHLSRRLTLAAQTPQGFEYSRIVDAHRRAAGDGHSYIDDSEIYSRYAGEVTTVKGDPNNLKITYPRDLSEGGGV